ncbi:LacI family DNA-binding transcriptional regulator [Alicyclobacillus sp. SO9]|uniref:LacI family DNA-binding transcriptional regulator n=1 Tax=Alicyclobacillus sp. SO9 TaxID=2665646 RepID=UPI0018E7BDE4|nr:LacI family DNA-binding transcriptional regulator [Alicyclobacillus sp. SO9]QQE79673.1 LacI family DNA-binding transcriptional regulator [Alicyclobacillus sp. SO9]
MKITIETVAQAAGVSVSTVSRVLNSPELVTEKTRNKVLKVLQDMDFQPNQNGRVIGTQRSKTIGIVVPGIEKQFFTELQRGIHKAAFSNDVNILLYDAGDGNFEESMKGVSFLKSRQCDAILYCSLPVHQEDVEVLERLDIPVAFALTGSSAHIPAFKVDDVAAAYDATAHLATRGHQHIAMISGGLTNEVAGQTRYDGYRLAIKEYNLPFSDEYVAYGDFRFDGGYEAMGRILENRIEIPITAVFAASDEMALGAMRRIHEAGLRVPDDISVMGFDNLSISTMVTPQLTTVAQPFSDIGESSIAFLARQIKDGRSHTDKGIYYFSHRIVSRESVKIHGR